MLLIFIKSLIFEFSLKSLDDKQTLLFDGGELSSSDGGDAAEKRLLENKKITKKTSLCIA